MNNTVGRTLVGVALQATAGKRTIYATKFEGARGKDFTFHRTESDGATVDDTYRVDACAVTLPEDRQTVADGRTITISGLRIPRLADASKPASSKARVRVEDGDRALELPVASTVHTRGVKRVTRWVRSRPTSTPRKTVSANPRCTSNCRRSSAAPDVATDGRGRRARAGRSRCGSRRICRARSGTPAGSRSCGSSRAGRRGARPTAVGPDPCRSGRRPASR